MTSRMGLSCLAMLLIFQVVVPAPPTGGDVLEEFAIDRDGGPLIIPVVVGGRSCPFVVDTGASFTLFDVSLRPHLAKDVEVKTLLTPTGPRQLTFASAPAASVGRLPLCKGSPVLLHDLTQIREAVGIDIRGFLGIDFLANYVVKIDFERGRLTLSRSPGRDAGQRLPLLMRAQRPWLEVNVMGAGPAEMVLVDTADSGRRPSACSTSSAN